MAKANVKRAANQAGSSAGVIILQWLTYVFWGWTILSLVWLVFIVLANFLTSQDTSDMVPYAVAATLVLLPLSLVCDIFYGRREPAKKTGAAMVVMVIHAVIFAVFGIGMLISAVLTFVQMMIGVSDSSDFQTVWLWTSLISAAVYALTFLRTLNPSPKLRLTKVYPASMAVIVGLFIVLGFAGPVAQAGSLRDDRDIEQSLSGVSRSVDRYVSSNGKLPQTLDQVELRAKEQQIVDRGLVRYKAIGEAPNPVTIDLKSQESVSDSLSEIQRRNRTEFRYELCVTYKKEDDSRSSYYDDDYSGGETYKSSVSTYGHPAGDVCYKLKATSTKNNE